MTRGFGVDMMNQCSERSERIDDFVNDGDGLVSCSFAGTVDAKGKSRGL